MRVLEQSADAAEIRARGCVVAIGTFDGVHLGHQKLISRAVELAREADVFSVVFTFRNHPMSVIAPDREPLSLYPLEERRRVFEKLGVDFVIEEPFTAELAALAPENFFASPHRASRASRGHRRREFLFWRGRARNAGIYGAAGAGTRRPRRGSAAFLF